MFRWSVFCNWIIASMILLIIEAIFINILPAKILNLSSGWSTLCVLFEAAMTTNLWLSPHGIWYFRKVYFLPSGKRKESRNKSSPICTMPPRYLSRFHLIILSRHLEYDVEVKSWRCCERELLTIRRFITRYITYLRQDSTSSTEPNSLTCSAKFTLIHITLSSAKEI